MRDGYLVDESCSHISWIEQLGVGVWLEFFSSFLYNIKGGGPGNQDGVNKLDCDNWECLFRGIWRIMNDPTRVESGLGVFEISRVGSGWVARF